tara:strand:- start:1919 stop:2092 length:174 start_codon:yes stop_codon:yes gene_type:complete
MTINYKFRKCQEHVKELERLLCEVMIALDEDFVPGPKLANLEYRFHALTGLQRGDRI